VNVAAIRFEADVSLFQREVLQVGYVHAVAFISGLNVLAMCWASG
jgi:hypothetical protein